MINLKDYRENPQKYHGYRKDFDGWNKIKKKMDHLGWKKINFFVNPKEIRYVKLGCNVWYEADGKSEYKRPVLIIRKMGNMFFCISLTTKWKKKSPWYYLLQTARLKKSSLLLLTQWRVLDKKRFTQYIGRVSGEEFGNIKKLLKDMYLGEVA